MPTPLDSARPPLARSDIAAALGRWFDDGHSRLAMVLAGTRQGKVLLASATPSGPQLTERHIVSGADGIIVSRSETTLSLDELAADPANGPALIQAVEDRLAGLVAPPPICRPPRPKP